METDLDKCKVEEEIVTIKKEQEDLYDDSPVAGSGGDCSDADVKVEVTEVKEEEDFHLLIKSENISNDPCGFEEGSEDEDRNKKNRQKVAKKKQFSCTVCKKTFPHLSRLKQHMFGHTSEKPFKCDICNKGFKQNGLLKSHMFEHNGLYPYKCDICSKGFVGKNNIKRHMRGHAADEGALSLKQSVLDCSVKTEGTGEPLLDGNQGVEESLPQRTKEEVVCRLEEQPVQRKRGKNLTYICNCCGRSFRCASALKTHLVRHSGEKPFKCDMCGEAFSRKMNLKSHIFKHKGEHPYRCEVCLKGFTTKNNIKRHMLIHTGEKLYKCEHCPKQFSCSRSFRKHKLKHHGDLAPYKCGHCSKTFPSTEELRQHEATHKHEINHQCQFCEKGRKKIPHAEPKRYVCERCGLRFENQSRFTVHVSLHEGGKKPENVKKFKCDVCEKLLRTGFALKNHMRIHTGERPFKCEFCEKSFRQPAHLRGHRMIHTGRRPFRCVVCYKGFITKTDFRKHTQTHSK